MKEIYMNRELSWLKFNERVLEEAEDEKVPLCERLSFASIYQTNLDEFFMVRVGSLRDQMLVNQDIRDNKTNMTAKEQIDAILEAVQKLNHRRDDAYEGIMEQLTKYGIRMVDFRTIGEEESRYLESYFDREIAPLISPTVVGKRQPFPFLKNREIYAVAELGTKAGKRRIGIVPSGGGMFDRLIEIPSMEGCFMLAEELILHFIPKIFKGYCIKAKSLIRVTRNADIDADALYDEDLDYREFMADLIKQRKKLSPVRLYKIFPASCPGTDGNKFLMLYSGNNGLLFFVKVHGAKASFLQQTLVTDEIDLHGYRLLVVEDNEINKIGRAHV